MAKQTEDVISAPILIRALKDGETYSRTERVAVASSDAGSANLILNRLRNRVNQSVARVRKEEGAGSNFRVESGAFLTDDRAAMMLTVAVTRLDGEEEDSDNDPI